MTAVPKLVEGGFVMSFFAMLLLMSISTGQVQVAYAGGKSPYESGYDHGCDDADISDPDDRYINQPERGPSFHTDAFMRGYNAGFNACSEGDSTPSPRSPGGGGGINWMQICRDFDQYIAEPCGTLVTSDNRLTLEGVRVLACFVGAPVALLYPELLAARSMCAGGNNFP
jgi:hypothetical protein